MIYSWERTVVFGYCSTDSGKEEDRPSSAVPPPPPPPPLAPPPFDRNCGRPELSNKVITDCLSLSLTNSRFASTGKRELNGVSGPLLFPKFSMVETGRGTVAEFSHFFFTCLPEVLLLSLVIS